MRLLLTLAGALLVVSVAHAVEVPSSTTQVGWIHTYPNFGAGDVVFSLVTPVSGCSGFWLNPSEPGFKQTYTTLMAAKAMQASVMVWADNAQIWPGSSSGQFCKVTVLRIE